MAMQQQLQSLRHDIIRQLIARTRQQVLPSAQDDGEVGKIERPG
jgi:hypothetical protein